MNNNNKKGRKQVGASSGSSGSGGSGGTDLEQDYSNGKKKKLLKNKKSKKSAIELKQYAKVESSDIDTSIDFEGRLGKMIPGTRIPYNHFRAMLRKEYITWQRNYKRSAFEILFPVIVFIVLAIIRVYISPTTYPFERNVERHMLQIGPMPNSVRMGLQHNDSQQDMLKSVYMAMNEQNAFYNFRGKSTPDDYLHDMFASWQMDNCHKSDYNKARKNWAIIGDPQIDSNRDIISQLTTDLKNYNNLRWNGKEKVEEFLEQFGVDDEDNGFNKEISRAVKKLKSFALYEDPMIFRTEQEFMDHITSDTYENWDAYEGNVSKQDYGICFGIKIDDNLSTFEATDEAPKIDVKIFLEMMDGVTPAAGRKKGQNITSQQTVCQSAMPVYDPFSKSPNGRCGEMYFRQGYSYIQNWISNAALKILTKNNKAQIQMAIVPMQYKYVDKDDFEDVLIAIYSYIVLILFILPMYSFILRIQVEKQSGIKQHLSIVGLSHKAQTLAMFISYIIQITIISVAIMFTMYFGGLFPHSFENSPFLLFMFTWMQGFSNFGFIIMICALLPQDMYPKLAAKWGTLIYFGSAFADFTIQKPAVKENDKILMSLLFPTLSTARASRNLCIYEYTPGGDGLNYDTLWWEYHNYRIITYFFIMVYAFFLHFTIGMLFERYGSVPQILTQIKHYFFPKKAPQAFSNIRKGQEDQVIEDESFNAPNEKVLQISQLVKQFKVQDDEKKTFTAVDNLSLTLYQSQIFALLGHNGAGKTTTISILTGMMEATSGFVSCFGKNLINDKNQANKQDIQFIQQIIGICPQHDILFEQLTVREHLEIYCQFKGIQVEKDIKINQIMKDIDVWPHRDTQAGSLSGGNKRKLSVALALVADSKLVILDEPTSGMDLNARRRLWDMLKNYKQDRIIILTTHNMNEADLLGDRIAIMSHGRVKCLGSPQFLKGHYGHGFKMQVLCKNEDKVFKFLKEKLGADVKRLERETLFHCFQIPFKAGPKFEKFFKILDEADLGIESYNIQVATLEDVFLKVVKTAHITAPVEKSENFVVDSKTSDQIDKYRQERSSANLLKDQTLALVARKMAAYKRQIISIIFEMMVPVILIAIGFTFTKMQFNSDSHTKILKADMYPQRQRLLVNSQLFQQIVDSDEKFDDDQPEPNQLFPKDLIQNLPLYSENFYDIEYLDVKQTYDIRQANNEYDPEFDESWEDIKNKEYQARKDQQKKLDEDVLAGEVILDDASLESFNKRKKRESDRLAKAEKAAAVKAKKETLERNKKETSLIPDIYEVLDINQISVNNETNSNDTKKANSSKVTPLKVSGNPKNSRNLKSKKGKPTKPATDIINASFDRNPYDEEKPVIEEQYHHEYFTHFSNWIYRYRGDESKIDGVWPYRYGSYFIYEANNDTKNFQVATFVNLTSQDGSALWPQYMYEAILKTASGRTDLQFEITNQPFPIKSSLRERQDDTNGIFVCFVAGISLALIPASIVTRIVNEKELGMHHMQIVSGVDLKAYWMSFFVFDIVKSYLPCIMIAILIELFNLKYLYVWQVLFIYPWAVVPFSYVTSHLFNRESTAQTFTIYLHFLLSGIAGMIIFALRMVESTAFYGDKIMWIFRFLCPTFQVCNSIIFASSRDLLQKQRSQIRADLRQNFKGKGKLELPNSISAVLHMDPDNIGGDIQTMIFHAIIWWFLFILIEKIPKGYFERGITVPKKDRSDLDEDVIEEENRVSTKCQNSQICVDKFSKAYKVAFKDPIVAVEQASFGVDYGECFALLGVNGAGKSTTFKSLTNVVIPSGGKIKVRGKDITTNFSDIRHRIGYCPQQHALFEDVTVKEHLEFYAQLKGFPQELHEFLINAAIRKLGIQIHINKTANQLSGGNKRKVQVAIALLGNPQIILLDEPSSGMDPAARRFMWQVVSGITQGQKNTCVILTTHSMDEAEALCTKMGIMVKGGKFTCFGSSQHIKDKFGSEYEIEFRLDQKPLEEGQQEIPVKELMKGMDKEFSEMLGSMTFQRDIWNSSMSKSEFSRFLQAYKCHSHFKKLFNKEFEKCQVVETFGNSYLKFKIPKKKSIGYVFGLIEREKGSWIQEYSVQPTTLEMIFQHFAQQ